MSPYSNSTKFELTNPEFPYRIIIDPQRAESVTPEQVMRGVGTILSDNYQGGTDAALDKYNDVKGCDEWEATLKYAQDEWSTSGTLEDVTEAIRLHTSTLNALEMEDR